MRLLIFFDLPTKTELDKAEYRKLSKSLKEHGFIRLQYSVYSKLCINSMATITAKKKFESYCPVKGDVRYLVLTETQYQSIKPISKKYSLIEAITCNNRLLIIGGDNDEDLV
ncbi:MAG: CRISPR-associated endonuclease Cas2 [Anaerorhabdus sp.]